MHFSNTDELNYLLGLSYLKELEPEQSRECFKRILKNPSSRFAKEADLGLADTYLVSGKLDQAAEMYNRLISSNPGSQEPAILYRLSQLEYRRGNRQKAGEYLSRLKNDFPLSPELKAEKEIAVMRSSPVARSAEYFIQAGFFSSRSNADNLKNKLLGRGYPAYVEDCKTGYRVKVGKFSSENEAAETGSRLSREGFEIKICP
jgi:tetratricopeptide (TPR) repeat protein